MTVVCICQAYSNRLFGCNKKNDLKIKLKYNATHTKIRQTCFMQQKVQSSQQVDVHINNRTKESLTISDSFVLLFFLLFVPLFIMYDAFLGYSVYNSISLLNFISPSLKSTRNLNKTSNILPRHITDCSSECKTLTKCSHLFPYRTIK